MRRYVREIQFAGGAAGALICFDMVVSVVVQIGNAGKFSAETLGFNERSAFQLCLNQLPSRVIPQTTAP